MNIRIYEIELYKEPAWLLNVQPPSIMKMNY